VCYKKAIGKASNPSAINTTWTVWYYFSL